MSQVPGIDAVQLLLRNFETRNRLFSTGAEIVSFSGDLFNVTGSTDDPSAIPGHVHDSWKNLLIEMAGLDEDTNCYVTNIVPPSGTSHPLFRVGGHMTPNESGEVAEGGVCYLMPLCNWHNSTSRNGIAFEHSETRMLKLTGYMQGELVTTFRLRQPSADPFSILYFDEGAEAWKSLNLPTDDPSSIESATLGADNRPQPLRLILERSEDYLYIKDSTLPSLNKSDYDGTK